jgi:hypothetical protein
MDAETRFPHLVIARIFEHIEPIARGERYEDPLQARLDRDSIGRITGGGSQLNESGGIDYADIEIELSNLNAAVRTVVESLESAGAPRGSELIDASNSRLLTEFGTEQCLAIFLDGTSLPDQVYADLDFDAVVAELGSAAGGDSYRGFWQGDEETGLYLFGPDADAMLARVEPVLRRLPIGQNARVVVRHGKKGVNPRELRMARHP